ncbi:hypothetical protein JCM9279_007019 [Rhodotorula babjevae]
MPTRTRPPAEPSSPSSSSPHPDASSSSSAAVPPAPRTRSTSRSDSIAATPSRRGDSASSASASPKPALGAPDEGASLDEIRLVGSYDSPDGVPSPRARTERSSSNGPLLSPSQQQPNKLARWLSGSTTSTSPTSYAVAKDAAALPDSPTKTRKARSRSIGSLNLLNRSVGPASSSPSSTSALPPAEQLAAPAPTISISSSPSMHFSPSPRQASTPSSASPMSSPELSTGAPLSAIPLRRGSGTSVSSAASAATTSSAGASSTRRGFANLSLKPSRTKAGKRPPSRPGSAGSSSLEAPSRLGEAAPDDEWARAELDEGDEEGRRISEAMQRAASGGGGGGGGSSSRASSVSTASGSLPGEGRLARGLRKTRSGLRLFSKAKEQQQAAEAEAQAASAATLRDGHSSPATVYAQPSSAGSTSLLDLSSSSGVTPTSSAFPSSSSGAGGPAPLSSSEPAAAVPLSPNSNVANRIGGWFSSMLHPGVGPGASSSSLHLPQQFGSTEDASHPSSTSPTKMRSSAGPPRAPSSPAGSSSPLKKGSASSSTGARFGPLDRMLDRAAQYFLDSDSQADRCEDDIWVLGVRHAGWRAPAPLEDERDGEGEGDDAQRKGLPGLGRRGRSSPTKVRKVPAPPPQQPSFAPAASTSAAPSSPSSRSSSPAPPPTTIHGWPASFYHDFYSRPALTYRSHFPLIPCDPPSSSATSGPSGGGVGGMLSNLGMSIGRGARAVPVASPSEERGLSTDAGWGCMLRTGQSLLANALVKVHLGRDWRRPLPATTGSTAASVHDPGTYARLLSLFLDDPSPLSPFSVHRFALEGKRLGKGVGEWFGPSTAAGAIKSLVNGYEAAGLRVVSCMDGTVYESEVVAASSAADGARWRKPVLVLINLRLGIDGINPIYHEAVKAIFRIPQSVGIAGGRPSSSYYFVGAQANALFYIDPHHPRPAIPLVLPTDDSLMRAAQHEPLGPADARSSHAQQLEAFLLDAYADSAWATYHCERVRKCALASLDPSMLLGFVVENERDWDDFRSRVTELSRTSAPIFSIAPSPPRWMRRTTSSAQPAAAHASTSATAAGDDSFSELGVDDAASMRAPSGPADLDEGSEGFSEPEDWELQSTDGSALGEDDGDVAEGEQEGARRAAAASGGGPSTGPVDGEEAVVVEAARADPPPPPSMRKERVDEGWLGVEAERSA